MHPWRIFPDREARAGRWHCGRERKSSVSAILLLGLLPWVEPASAQKVKVYPLTVSIHEEMRDALNQKIVEGILKNASKLMKRNNCPVKFELKEFKTFTSAPANIDDESDLEAVHRVPADVKVVRKINFCVGERKEDVRGCAWRPGGRQKTVIVTTFTAAHHILWLHEFGHTAGLPHRIDNDGRTLMTPCAIKNFNDRINQDECRHFRAGPVHDYPPERVECPTPAEGSP